MANQSKHPHRDNPSFEEILEQLKHLRSEKESTILDTFASLHQTILNTLPEIHYAMDLTDGQIGYGAKQYGYDGWGMVALAHHKTWVNLHFMKGAELSTFDENRLLEGNGKQLRHVKCTTPEEVKKMEEQLQQLLIKAANLLPGK